MEDKGKSVADKLREVDGQSGCSPMTIARTVGLDEPKCLGQRCDSCLGLTLSALADAIDAEVAEAREASARGGMEFVAAAEEWPDLRDGESVVEWMDRCWLPRPRYEDGEPVQWGDEVDGLDEPVDAMVVFDDGSGLLSNHNHPYLMDGPSFGQDSQVPIRRRISEVLGADGLPINEDDTVYGVGMEQHTYTVWAPLSINKEIGGRFSVKCYDQDVECVVWCDPSVLTHTMPDTQQTIDDDATMAPAYYCAQRGIDLGDDPDREKATTAMITDLLRRQRELDKRKG